MRSMCKGDSRENDEKFRNRWVGRIPEMLIDVDDRGVVEEKVERREVSSQEGMALAEDTLVYAFRKQSEHPEDLLVIRNEVHLLLQERFDEFQCGVA